MSTQTTKYNQVRQKGSHNSYQRSESYTDQAVYWRIRSLEIDIHNSNSNAGWPTIQADWYVYHASIADQGTSVNTLSDALEVLNSFHKAVPNHEVITIWLDLKDSFDSANDQTPDSLDALLVSKLGRSAIWGPPDLIGQSTNLQAAATNNGWPELTSLQGKFIFACTTGDLSSPTSHLNQYVNDGTTANVRLAFVAPEISSSSQITAHDYAVFFNLNSGNSNLGSSILNAGFISRAYGLDSKSSWCSAWNSSVHHLTTNKVNAYNDEWARTDLPDTGYPFTGLTQPLPGSLTEPGVLYAIKVSSEDIWGSDDSFYFQYNDKSSNPTGTIVSFVGNQQSHVDGWIKGGIMTRQSTAASAAYVAVLITASKGIRMQYRSAGGKGSNKVDAKIPNGINGKPVVSQNTPIWLQLALSNDGKTVSGSYSIDGIRWQYIGQVTVNESLSLQGWAASSHGDGQVKWLFGGMSAPSQGQAIGSKSSGSFISSSAQAASLGPLSDTCS